MSQTLTASELLDHEFLEMRCRILDLAASFDRIERAEGIDRIAADHTCITQLRKAIKVLVDEQADRAKRVQMVFSRPYDKDWRERSGGTA